MRGFLGWALAMRSDAEDWVEGRRPLAFEASRAGPCVLVNAWAADDPQVHRFLLDRLRIVVQGHHTIYFKRHYADGRVRPGRLAVNAFVASHVARRRAPQA